MSDFEEKARQAGVTAYGYDFDEMFVLGAKWAREQREGNMKTNKFDINDLVSVGISAAEQATGRITEIQLSEGEILYYADLDKSTSGWYTENDFVLLANCELDADYYGHSPAEDLIELSKEMGEPRVVPVVTERPSFKDITEKLMKDLMKQTKSLDQAFWDSAVYGTAIFNASIADNHIVAPIYWPDGTKIDAAKKLGCNHQWVDVGFMQSKIVCKHCNQEQDS